MGMSPAPDIFEILLQEIIKKRTRFRGMARMRRWRSANPYKEAQRRVSQRKSLEESAASVERLLALAERTIFTSPRRVSASPISTAMHTGSAQKGKL
jgi:hypothetical protein